ncbi:MAG: DUF736 domain-containing protein [Alphaproteobacteria bacterium]|nr:DUF736 domain-containing protein [Alphaproteobacteria bacterium]
MSQIGQLQPVTINGQEELQGEISTLQMQLPIRLIPNRMKNSDAAPDYVICSIGNNDQDIQIGAAWKKTKSKPGGEVFEFLSVTVDDPSLPTSLNVAAFKNSAGGWDISWRRRQDKNN